MLELRNAGAVTNGAESGPEANLDRPGVHSLTAQTTFALPAVG